MMALRGRVPRELALGHPLNLAGAPSGAEAAVPGDVTRVPDAPSLVLAAPDAIAVSIAMPVGSASAESGRGNDLL